jgi:hypothetical protein
VPLVAWQDLLARAELQDELTAALIAARADSAQAAPVI